jgi:hypothetical protein
MHPVSTTTTAPSHSADSSTGRAMVELMLATKDSFTAEGQNHLIGALILITRGTVTNESTDHCYNCTLEKLKW